MNVRIETNMTIENVDGLLEYIMITQQLKKPFHLKKILLAQLQFHCLQRKCRL